MNKNYEIFMNILEKGFQKKPIDAFTNSTVFILDFYLTCSVLNPDYKYLHARQTPYQLSFPSQTMPDRIRYIIGVFCYRLTLNHR